MSSSASSYSSSRPYQTVFMSRLRDHTPSIDDQTRSHRSLCWQIILHPLSPSASMALVPFLFHGAPHSFTGRKCQRTKASSSLHVEIDNNYSALLAEMLQQHVTLLRHIHVAARESWSLCLCSVLQGLYLKVENKTKSLKRSTVSIFDPIQLYQHQS